MSYENLIVFADDSNHEKYNFTSKLYIFFFIIILYELGDLGSGILVLGFGHWALGSGLLVLGFWHLRAMPLGSGVSDPIAVPITECREPIAE